MSNIVDIYQLSPLQEGMLFHTLYDTNEENYSPYINQVVFLLAGELDIEVFEKSWNYMVNRYEIFRSAFVWEEVEEPLQAVLQTVPLKIKKENWTELTKVEQEKKLNAFLIADRKEGFCFDDPPLMRVTVIEEDDKKFRVIWTHHHLLLDGWSGSVVLDELFTIYQKMIDRKDIELPKPPPYSKYIDWIRRQDKNQAENFWREELRGFTSPTLLGMKQKNKKENIGYGESVYLISEEQTQILQVWARNNQLTLNTVFQGAWAYLLSKYSGEKDVLFGAISSGRPTELVGVEKMVGLFINTLPARIHVPEKSKVVDWLQQLQKKELQRRKYEYTSLTNIQGWSEIPQGIPLFQTLYAFENYPVKDTSLDMELEILEHHVEEQVNYPLSLVILPGNQVGVKLMYDRSRFGEETIQRIQDHFLKVLFQMTAVPDQTLSEVTYLSEIEEKQLLEEWNNTTIQYPKECSVQELFEQKAVCTPEAVAAVYNNQQITYKELNERANQLAHYLRKQGVEREMMVGICIERSLEMIVGLLGILKAGGAYVPLDPTYPEQRLKYISQDSGVNIVITKEDPKEWLPEGIESICLDRDRELISQESIYNPEIEVEPENLAYVIYTSGSTGNPKGVMVEHRSLLNLVFWHQDVYKITEQDRATQIASVAFDAAVWEIWPYLTKGASLYIPNEMVRTNPEALKEWLVANQVSISFMPTPLAERMLKVQWPQETALRVLLTGGDTLRQYPSSNLPFTLINHYGPTECTVVATMSEVYMELTGCTPPIGRPIANTEVYVLDENRNPVPIGVAGELCIGGAGLARGYLNRPELTEDRFIPHPFSNKKGERLYRTGDSVKYLSDGNLEYLGRIDNQVKIRGFRIELGEIEVVLGQHPDIKEVVVVAQENKLGEKQLVAYIVGDGDSEKWREHVKGQLPNYMVPVYFVKLDELPLTPNGKVDTKALSLPAEEVVGDGYVPPRTQAEELVVAVWKQVLGRDKIGVYDDFFELGGHSLLATQIVSRLQEAFEIEMPLRELFEHSTVEALAQQLEKLHRGGLSKGIPSLTKMDRGQIVPLSYAQQRLWFFDRFMPKNTLYNIPITLRLKGIWVPMALEKSLNALINRHEILRTTIQEIEGETLQVISSSNFKKLPVIDLSHLPLDEKEQVIYQLIRKEAETPFDLEIGPLLRVNLIRLEQDEWILSCTMHHIISDGWSMGVFLKEWMALYEEEVEGVPARLPELSIQYADYAQWQRKWLDDSIMKEQLDYWMEELSGDLPVLQLPTDRQRPSVQTYSGAMHYFLLPDSLSEQLELLSRQEGATLFMTLLAAYQSFLSRYTSQSDILVGSPIANRHYKETEGLIGFFVNTLAYRVQLNGDSTFQEVLSQVRQKVLKAYDYQDIPFEKVVEKVQPDRSTSYSPLFQTMFTMNNTVDSLPKLNNRSIENINMDTSVAKFDLTVSMEKGKDGILTAFEYNTDLFDASTIERMANHFQYWLNEVTRYPERLLIEHSLMPNEEVEKLVVEWNKTKVAYPNELVIQDLLEEQVNKNPDAIAIVYEGQVWSYRELHEQANQLAHYLQKQGVKSESLVGLCVERSPDMIIGALGILKAGGAYVPLDPAYPEQRLRYMSQDSGIQILITQEDPKEWLSDGIENIYLDRDRELISQESIYSPVIDVAPENLAYVIYTSGSTGNPKGVMVEHRSLVNLVFWHQDVWKITEQDRGTQIAGTAFDVAVLETWPYLAKGASLYIPTEMVRTDPEALRDWLVANQISIAFMPTPLAERALKLQWPEETALRILLTAGQALKHYPVHDLPFILINGYGPAECTVLSTICEFPMESTGGTPPIGRPIANTEIYVLDKNQKPVPIGVAGEIYIGGVGVSRGYLNRPELTEERFIPDPFSNKKGARLYRTGDFAKYLSDGNLEYLGRIDNQVKIRGFRIELGEIEAVLGQHPTVKEVVVMAQENKLGEKQLVAYIVGDGNSEEWREYVKAQLPNYMVPVYFVKLNELPLTPNGKVNTKALSLPAEEVVGDGYVPPRTQAEELVVVVWKQVLGRENIGVYDDFFELGGHSLLATQVVSRLQEVFQTKLPLRELFQHSTVEGLSQRITALLQEDRGYDVPLLQPKERGERVPLSYAQQRLWFLDQLEPNSSLYNIPTAWCLKGKWRIEALEKGYNALIQRHEVLRTVIQEMNGEPMQVIKAYTPKPLQVIDLRHLPKEEKDLQMQNLVQMERETPFCLEEGPLIRTQLIIMEEEELVLLCTMHHIISDGWSMGILFDEWFALYKAFVEEKPAQLPPLALQYADFAQWQRNWLKDEVLAQQLGYWQKELSGELPVLQLPFDSPRPAVQSYKGNTYQVTLPASLLDKIKVFSREVDATLFMTLLAGYQGFLSRYTGQQDILVGSPIANRNYKEIEGLIGFFVNTLVYRANLTEDSTFKELVAQVKGKALKAQEYQDVPFEKIVEVLQPERNASHSPIFQTMFTLQTYSRELPKVLDHSLEPIQNHMAVAKFDLTVGMEETEEGLQLAFEYNTDLFNASTIKRMAKHFENWLSEVMDSPQKSIGSLKLMSKGEEKQLLKEWNDTRVEYPTEYVIQEL
ncbi:amino acid adenylation domain-containing protein, partial [Bacillus cereus group sp. N18]|uniref:amino acid adenylation domain-containing protein n=2 Tax=unclassified Bacillus cereus group TaxID=2750818 RepID=UPI0018F40A0C